MRPEDIITEWQKCRESIGRLDDYLLKIRLLGVSVFTLLFIAIAGVVTTVAEKKISIAASASSTFMFALIALLLFIATIYVLDRYYERLLLAAVLRASRLETHQLQGFRVGLTTEIEFQKDQFSKPKWWARFARASLMVNIAYFFMLAIVIIEYMAITWPGILTTAGLVDSAPFFFAVAIVLTLFFFSNLLLKEPNNLIQRRSKIVVSPVVLSKREIEMSMDAIATDILAWLKEKDVRCLNMISILTGARQFAEGIADRITKKQPDMEIRLFPLRVRATKDNALEDRAEVCYGKISKESLVGKATLILDDLVDSGKSLQLVKEAVRAADVREVRTAVLINKFADTAFKADFVGFDLALDKAKLAADGVADYWLFGFGMDIDESYREIDHIGWIPIMAKG